MISDDEDKTDPFVREADPLDHVMPSEGEAAFLNNVKGLEIDEGVSQVLAACG